MPKDTPTRTQLLRAYNQDEFPGWYAEWREDNPSHNLPVLTDYRVVRALSFMVARTSANLVTGVATLELPDGHFWDANVYVQEADLISDCWLPWRSDMSKVLKVWLDHFIVGLLENDDLEDGEFSITCWNDLPA